MRFVFLISRRLAYLIERNLLNGMTEDICNDISLQLVMRNAWICLHSIDKEFWDKEANRQMTGMLIDLFQRNNHIVFITGEQLLRLKKQNPDIWEISLKETEMPEDIRIWKGIAAQYVLEEEAGLEFFANTYHFTPVQIEQVFQNADKRRQLKNAEHIGRADIKQACIWEVNSNSNHLVTIMNTGCSWEELVLPAKQKEQLRTACNRILHKWQVYGTWGFEKKAMYGKGVSMVFSGMPGTEKP